MVSHPGLLERAVSSQSESILIAGYYGFGNTGDEAILAAICDDLRERQPDVKLVVVSGDPAATEATHGVTSVAWTDISQLIAAVSASGLERVMNCHTTEAMDLTNLASIRMAKATK